MNGRRHGVERFVAALVPGLLGAAVGIAGNGMYDDFGYRAVGMVTALAGVLSAGLWLRGLPRHAPLRRYVSGTLLCGGLAAAVAAAVGPRHLSPYATLVAAGLTFTALLVTPGIAIANTLFRVALVGFAVALLGGTVVQWRHGSNAPAIALVTFLELGVILLVYVGARYGAATIVTEAEAGEHHELGPPFLALGVLFSLGAVVAVAQGAPGVVGAPGSVALAAFGLGAALLKGGRYPVGGAILGCGVAGVVAGATFATMPDGLLLGVTVVAVGLALTAFGARRLDLARWLRAWVRYLTGQPSGPDS